MSYLPAGQTELIARQGYSGMGAVSTYGAYDWCWDQTLGQHKCIKKATGAIVKDANCELTVGTKPGAGERFKQAIFGVLTGSQKTCGQMAAAAKAPGAGVTAAAGMPPWVLPVAIGGGVLVLVLVLKKK